MKNNLKISIIMPVYNSGIYLKQAVQSILTQNLHDFELIIVDDGSTDGSAELCDYYSQIDSRVIVIHQKNSGLCNARNAALSIARGEYVAFSDHDDEYLQNLLKDNYAFVKKHNLDFVKFCKKWDTLKNGKILYSSTNKISTMVLDRNAIKTNIMELNKRDFFSCVWDGLYKRSFLEEHRITFNPFFKFGGEDYDFIYRCLIAANRIGFNSKVYYHHFTRYEFSTSTKFDPNKIEVVKKRFEMFKSLTDAYNLNLNNYAEEYTRFFIKDCVIPIIMQLNRGNLVFKEKMKVLDSLQNVNYYYDFISSHILGIRNFKHLAVVHFLFIKKKYKVLLKLYKVKEFIRINILKK